MSNVSRFPSKMNGDVLYEGVSGSEKGAFYNVSLETSELIDCMEAKYGIGKIPKSESLRLHMILSEPEEKECRLIEHPILVTINNIRLRI